MIRTLLPKSNAIGAKFTPSAPRQTHIPRPHIAELISTSRWAKLVLVRAPAGFGKTTAMAQCRAFLEDSGNATAWVTLDGADNDLARFLNGLSQAIKLIEGVVDSPPAVLDSTAGRPLADMVSSVTSWFAGHTQPFVLFLDDFELITESTVLRMVQVILDYLPRHGRVIIGSRNSPPLGLGRLRAHGQLLEVDAEQLRFSIDEARAFFSGCSRISINSTELSSLYEKTEGWVAGLWLASLALERRSSASEFVSEFSGSEQSVAQYLAEDVLAQQPPEVREFLLKTSILRSLEPELCEALTNTPGTGKILQQLSQANVLVRRLDGASDALQYHSLFASFLYDQLSNESSDEVPLLHARAAAWYATHKRPELALEHAFKGHDYPLATRLLTENSISLLAQGRTRLLYRWLSELPTDMLQAHPDLQAIQIWAVAFNRGAMAAFSQLGETGLESSESPNVQAHLMALKPVLLAMMDRGEEAWNLALRSAERLPTNCTFADTVLTNFLAEHSSVMGSRADTGRLLDLARRSQVASTSTFNLMYSEVAEGLVDLQEARLRQAAARFRMGSLAKGNKLGQSGGYALAGVSYAATLYESNELDSALRLLHVYVPLVQALGLPDHLILGHRLLARIAFSSGDVDLALQTLNELEYLGHEKHLPRVLASAKLERARIQVLQGHWQSAGEELDRADDPQVWERVTRLRLPANDVDYLKLGRLRLSIARGQAEEAVPELEKEIADAEKGSRRRRVLNLRLLLSLAQWRAGKHQASLQEFSAVLQVAHVEGFMRMFLDEGEAVAALLAQFMVKQERLALSGTPLLDDFLLRLTTAFGPLMAAKASPPPVEASVFEPLTRKEVQVLKLLADGYSNSAMATKLYVSDSTVRTHLRNINSKLGATNRTQAVALARSHGLI